MPKFATVKASYTETLKRLRYHLEIDGQVNCRKLLFSYMPVQDHMQQNKHAGFGRCLDRKCGITLLIGQTCPCKIHVFSLMKELTKRRYHYDDEVKDATQDWLSGIGPDFLVKGF
ncbi:hypothetical protein NPIL_634821 [Nephila pilipes]|uniref:Uncharacterized protein n=1 Tax=Nephila pilipes TaxID=299642 RepID=A0A8X6UE68_NEPPI|nr:hypothetical protein NPIL_634821 [Nephila pilipes]